VVLDEWRRRWVSRRPAWVDDVEELDGGSRAALAADVEAAMVARVTSVEAQDQWFG
jgi:hypothetical protein